MKDGSRTEHYDFELPPALIAQTPAAVREESRLMVVDRRAGTIEHRVFRDIADLIKSGDGLAINTTRVFRARLLGTRASGAPAEILLLRDLDRGVFEAMVSPGGKLKPGRTVTVSETLSVDILEVTERGTRLVRLKSSLPLSEAIEQNGHVPLPPYIDRSDELSDSERYQTVYASESGSVAAPTAGLHFSRDLLTKIEKNGVRLARLVLHVGAGTFKPVEASDPGAHVMHEERYEVSAGAAAALTEVKLGGGGIWAVGTTTVRTLESAGLNAGRGETRIFIRPKHEFRVVDHIITNFHLPRSTLIMLVAAFAGYDLTMHAYSEAIREGYRFYSYGDAMAII